ncbi:5'-3' exoribonuclease 2 [Seminavis robusta]|uniref:5'-3' exoribonuclease 2 n=1 Tax=Seminavis robusta TaxID=568900 RepID=A0A9N8DU20_9STRA|nr:5'-3' exoribonuclease 2 [Seminavis robusta]|eukprot:Sro249_g098610.1 5'-3' exoribonuclease 2 (886) ;mRNA; f:18590-21493
MYSIPRSGSHDTFDHVLIDMNQLLHVCLRKSKSDGHALTLLMKELDECCRMATPTKSLVLAMDGPPSASKLATQRLRRLQTIVRTDRKLLQMEQLALASSGNKKRVFSKTRRARKQWRYQADTRTLRITPGTDFMILTEQAILYWAWQRLQNNNPRHYLNRVKIYISPSTVAGEGEVKLLEWILRQPQLQLSQKQGQSIAILGGDSDLVLESLAIPPSFTHNVFVLLPDGNQKYLSVSLWETTRALAQFLPRNILASEHFLRVRTDLVLLLILNGNDYFPKLRGSSGFHKVFHAYLRTLREWLASGDQQHHPPFLVEPERLTYNLPFCIAFFRRLEKLAPPGLLWGANMTTAATADAGSKGRNTPLAKFNGLKQHLVTLRLGTPGTEDYVSYEIWQPVRKTLKRAKHKLANMALEDLFGDVRGYYEKVEKLSNATSDSYSWDIGAPVEGKADLYLGGLLWNLQTYQDGVCPDYSFNYGKRLSPTAGEIVRFFKTAMKENVTLGMRQLLPNRTTYENPSDGYPVSAGVSCLAALPSQVRDLVPEPYRQLDDETVEKFYSNCMDPVDNVFDLKGFERLCDEAVEEMGLDAGKRRLSRQGLSSEEDLMDMSHYWLVLSKARVPLSNPIDPPPPFSERLSELRPNNRIRVNRLQAVWKPRRRAVWEEGEANSQKELSSRDPWEQAGLNLAEPDEFLGQFISLEHVLDYKRAYQRQMKTKKNKSVIKETANGSLESATTTKKKKRKPVGVTERMLTYEYKPPPKKYATTTEGQSALACLKQLSDAGLVGAIEWKITMPSPSEYASFNPEEHELVTLTVQKASDPELNILNDVLIYEQDRDINHVSRQALKQHLSTFAICDIVGPEIKWTTMTFKDLRLHIAAKNGAKSAK